MSLKEQFQQALAKLSPFSGDEQLIQVGAGDHSLACQLTELDRLACAFSQLQVHSDKLQGLSIDRLKQIAVTLSGKLTYLLEPISPIETDALGCVVQMRSNPPQKAADRTTYYELLVAKAGEVSLCRYTRSAGQQRQPISAEVTREVLLRLVGDIAGVAE